MRLLKYITLIANILLMTYSCTTNQLTNQEKHIVNNGANNEPFKVLLTTNEQDSMFLRQKSTAINLEEDKDDVLKLIERLKATLEAEQGVGIAAPQVGIARNLFLFVRTDKPHYPVEVAINPRIVNYPDETICFERDGCLSVPDQSGNSIRYPWIEVEYTNEQGVLTRERLEGYSRLESFVAVIFQHEYDHLQGVLFTDKLCD